ncbi:MAG TPA: hypothetical protein VF593_01200 [Chthoniobacteraceae bacterium]
MSTSTPAFPPSAGAAHQSGALPAKRRFPLLRAGFAVLLLALASLFEPHCFRFAIKQLVRWEAWRWGVHAQIGGVQGSAWEPVTLTNSVWVHQTAEGAVSRLAIQEARADLSLRELFRSGSTPWFRSLKLDGVSGKIEVPLDAMTFEEKPALEWLRPNGRWITGPERVEARRVDFTFATETDFVRLQDASFSISEVAAGEITVGQLTIKQPWLTRSFRNLRGTTKLEGARAEFAGVMLQPGVELRSLSAKLDRLARGRLSLEMNLRAFGGEIRIGAQTLAQDHQLRFEATGTFSQISIGQLATFLALSEATGGTIERGRFTFRGSPQDPSKATALLRLDEVTNFQWESRQWNSLVLGATLMNERVQIPELTLHQGHNHLTLNGDFALPGPGQTWWQREFAFNIAAKIDNLTELSALLLPEFKFAAGQATIDGAVRGKDQQFNGQIIVAGNKLTWRNAPIEELHATLKLNGNELQLSNLSMFNNGDFVRGRGVVNILGDKQYWGELHAAIDELGKYAALQQQPIVAEPLAGGARIEWSGEGSARGHTGKFDAQLRKVRSLGASAALLHPINVDLSGTYQPGAMLFSRFALSDDDSWFSANVTVGNKALSLQNIRFTHAQQLQLEGDALLPLDVWKAWPNTSLAELLDDTTSSKVALTAYNLDLHAASQLTGWNFPIEGNVRGKIAAEGPLGAVKSSGRLTLSKGRLPLGWSGVLLEAVEGEADLDAQHLLVKRFGGRTEFGDFAASGLVDFQNARDPALKLAVASKRLRFPMFELNSLVLTTSFDGAVEGTWNHATLQGLARPTDLSVGTLENHTRPSAHQSQAVADITSIWDSKPGRELKPIFRWNVAPWKPWMLKIDLQSDESSALTPSGILRLDLQIGGAVGAPRLEGIATFASLPLISGNTLLLVREGTITWRGGEPLVSLSATGGLHGEAFTLHLVGPLMRPARYLDFAPPLTEALIRSSLSGAHDPASVGELPKMELTVSAPLLGATQIVPWPEITLPPPPSPEALDASVPAAP